ncbi:mediator of RNA polymerase II transcription subunit 18 [Scheffersomyces xylosifermentans]|uniref:mediator of RNA polymerase II transcription subunit 18 n=1 Tax=Scheffersomyces xylosifermentans TaxID=1304137 RepID=UPI00315D4592
MVHQLSLVSSIPHSSYIQTISTLQALTGLLSPQPISTYTLLTKPHDVFKPKFEPGKVNQIEQYFMKAITTWSDSGNMDISKPILKKDKDTEVSVERLFTGEEQENQRKWTLQISDIPVAGKNQACSAQTIYESTLIHTHTKVTTETVTKRPQKSTIVDENAMEIDDLEPDVEVVKVETAETKEKEVVKEEKEGEVTKDAKQGEENKIEIDDEPEKEDSKASETTKEKESELSIENKEEAPSTLDELHISTTKDSFLQFLEDLGYDVVNQYWIKGIRFFHGDTVIEIFKVLVRDDEEESSDSGKIKLKLLDESNTFQIKTYINIAKSTDIDQINQGTKELLRLQEFLKNLFKLEIPDRMFMDSRVMPKKQV